MWFLHSSTAALPCRSCCWSCYRRSLVKATCSPWPLRLQYGPAAGVSSQALCRRSFWLASSASMPIVNSPVGCTLLLWCVWCSMACKSHLCVNPCANRDRSTLCSSTLLTSKFRACGFSPASQECLASILLRPHVWAVPPFPASGWPRSVVVVARMQLQQSQQLHPFSSLPWCERCLWCTWRCILCP